MDIILSRRLALLVLWITFAEVCRATQNGFFELQIVRLQNTAGELNSGECCDGNRQANGICPADKCDTFLRLCLKEYQISGSDSSSDTCTFGFTTTSVLGGNSLSIDRPDDPDNPGRIKIPLRFTWMRTYTLILEVLDRDNVTGDDDGGYSSHSELITRHVHSGMLSPGSGWHTVTHSGNAAHVVYRVRVRCNQDYYGFNCTKFCRPRDTFFGHYTCDNSGNKKCMEGWMGEDCKTPQCKIGCSTEHGFCESPNQCTCRFGWEGDLCTECKLHPGCVHGTCNSPFECKCKQNWGGLLCTKDLNYCGRHKPCMNGGSCTNPEPDSFNCSCPQGYAGEYCEKVKFACVKKPCHNGGICENIALGFRCQCQPGWTGKTCRTNIDDCASAPCAHGGRCTDLVNGFSCKCPSHWEGATCQLDKNECEQSPCVHARNCHNMPGKYHCVCEPGWGGTNCDINVDDCVGQCRNGATCRDLVKGYQCICAPGFSGKNCSININDCEADSCLHGGQCVDHVNGFNCICPVGFSGRRCEREEGYCEPDPCQNGADCFNMNDDYYCNCSAKFEGKNCSRLRNECESKPCEVIDSCTIHVSSNESELGYVVQASDVCGRRGTCKSLPDNEYTCECDSGYEGKHCQFNVNDCVYARCENGGTCVDGMNSYTCICAPGFAGRFCQLDEKNCSPTTCRGRGSCIDLVDNFMCSCDLPWMGRTCNSRVDPCDENPCDNEGVCAPSGGVGRYVCRCQESWTGKICTERKTSVCSGQPCLNNGTCVGDGNTFSCYCMDGFTGDRCQDDEDDCNPHPCYNSGRCVDGINHYTCICLPGFAGPDCRINIDECLSNPCAHGSTCMDLVDGYKCLCQPGMSGPKCDRVDGPQLACVSKGISYPHGSQWNEVCNSCKCHSGKTECSKVWCGPPVCYNHKMDNMLRCPSRQTCKLLTPPECFTPDCKAKGVCQGPDPDSPYDPKLRFVDSVKDCLPNRDMPSHNCARVTCMFNKDEVTKGMYVHDLCLVVRSLPLFRPYALRHALVIQCDVASNDTDAIQITIASNTSDPKDSTATEASTELATYLPSATRNSALAALTEVRLETTILKGGHEDYLIPLLTSLAAVLIAITAVALLVCVCICRRSEQRGRKDEEKRFDSSRRSDSIDRVDNNNKRLEEEAASSELKSLKVIGNKINNVELRDRNLGNLAPDVNRLPGNKESGGDSFRHVYKKISTIDLAVSAAAAEKLTVGLSEPKNVKAASVQQHLARDAGKHPKRYSQPHNGASSSAFAAVSSNVIVADGMDVIDGHVVAPHHPQPQGGCPYNSHRDDISDEDEVFESPGRRLLQGGCGCHDPRPNDPRCPHAAPDEYSESEEVAMLMSGPRRHSNQQQPQVRQQHRCRHHRIEPHGSRHRRRTPQSAPLYPDADPDCVIADDVHVTSSQAGGMSDSMLPPYESVVGGESRSATPCDCPHARQASLAASSGAREHLTPAAAAPGYHQSPPPCYSRHYHTPTQTYRSTSALSPLATPNERRHFISPTYANVPGSRPGSRARPGAREPQGEVPRRSASPCDDPTTDLLSSDKRSPHELSV